MDVESALSVKDKKREIFIAAVYVIILPHENRLRLSDIEKTAGHETCYIAISMPGSKTPCYRNEHILYRKRTVLQKL